MTRIKDAPGLTGGGLLSFFEMALGLDDFDHRIHILFADLLGVGLDHDPYHGFRAALPHQDPSAVTQGLTDLLNSLLNIGIVLGVGLALYPDILEHLGIEDYGGCQLAHGLLLGEHDLHELQGGNW